MEGRIQMSPDFDAPLSEEDLKEWGLTLVSADADVLGNDVPTIDARK
jgi:hypothetical protein